MGREVDVIRNQLARNHIRLLPGHGRLADRDHVEVSDLQGGLRTVQADRIVIATGTTPAHPPGVEFDEATILDSDGILLMSRIPSTLVVVGAGVIGIEYASIFAALGTRVTVVEKRDRLLEFCDNQMVEALQYYLRDLGVVFRLGETVTSVEKHDGGTLTTLASGKRIAADAVMYSAGRQGATSDLGLEGVGIEIDARGRICVDEHYRTTVEHIYAVGDVIGFPSLASASFEQGRLAAAHAFGLDARPMRDLLPIGIYTIPEISFAGRTEEELTADEIPYEIGVSRYRELARGQILGDSVGILKLLVQPDSRTILGVHVFGTAATELVHIGQTVMGLGGTVDYLIDQVFNYPTLAESYKVAALDATNKLRALNRLSV
jgi:NAD(P) transhydrogenase